MTSYLFCHPHRVDTLVLYLRTEEAAMSPITAEPGVVELDRHDGREFLDRKIRAQLGMTLEQFEAAYDAGTLDLDDPDVFHLVMLLPFAR